MPKVPSDSRNRRGPCSQSSPFPRPMKAQRSGLQAEDPKVTAARARERAWGLRLTQTRTQNMQSQEHGVRKRADRDARERHRAGAHTCPDGRPRFGARRPRAEPCCSPGPPSPHVPHEARVRSDRVPRHHQVFLSIAAKALTEGLASHREPHLHRHLGANDLRRRSSATTHTTPLGYFFGRSEGRGFTAVTNGNSRSGGHVDYWPL